MYRTVNDSDRRNYNQAWFSKIYIDATDDDEPRVADHDRTPFSRSLESSRRLVSIEHQKHETDPGGSVSVLHPNRSHGQGLISEPLVDLSGQLSNPAVPLAKMLASASTQVKRQNAASAAPTPRQRQVRLSDSQRRELVARFEAGAFKEELARAYGVHVETVRGIIARAAEPAP